MRALSVLLDVVKQKPAGFGTPAMPAFLRGSCAGDGDAAAGAEAEKTGQGRFTKGDAQLREVVEQGLSFKARSPLGWQFKTAIDKDSLLKQQFEEAEDQEQFKMNWARKKYESAAFKRRSHDQSQEEGWVKGGTLCSWLKQLEEEGGVRGADDPETVENCRIHALRCVDLGYPFIQAILGK